MSKQMKAKTLSVLILLAVALAVPMVVAVQPSGTKLISKDTTTWQPLKPYGKYPGGEIQYLNKGMLRLTVYRLQPNSQYMVTLQGEWPEGSDLSTTDTLLGDYGYFDLTDKYSLTLGWADVAFFKTNKAGHANLKIPNGSGVWDPGFLQTLDPPPLKTGTYVGVRVVVKHVDDGTGLIDWNAVIWGLNPVLFEENAFGFTVP